MYSNQTIAKHTQQLIQLANESIKPQKDKTDNNHPPFNPCPYISTDQRSNVGTKIPSQLSHIHTPIRAKELLTQTTVSLARSLSD
jgi:hypothetical protein